MEIQYFENWRIDTDNFGIGINNLWTEEGFYTQDPEVLKKFEELDSSKFIDWIYNNDYKNAMNTEGFQFDEEDNDQLINGVGDFIDRNWKEYLKDNTKSMLDEFKCLDKSEESESYLYMRISKQFPFVIEYSSLCYPDYWGGESHSDYWTFATPVSSDTTPEDLLEIEPSEESHYYDDLFQILLESKLFPKEAIANQLLFPKKTNKTPEEPKEPKTIGLDQIKRLIDLVEKGIHHSLEPDVCLSNETWCDHGKDNAKCGCEKPELHITLEDTIGVLRVLRFFEHELTK